MLEKSLVAQGSTHWAYRLVTQQSELQLAPEKEIPPVLKASLTTSYLKSAPPLTLMLIYVLGKSYYVFDTNGEIPLTILP